MSEVKFKKLKDFGTIHRNEKRIIVASLQETQVREKGVEKTNLYFSFHEHFKAEDGTLIPRRLNNPNAKFPEKIISFTLPFTETTANELKTVVSNIEKYMSRDIKADNEKF
jgi:hypothetical protein